MNIFPLIYLPIALYALANYHRAFLVYAIMKLFITNMVPLYSGPPTIFMESFMSAFMFMSFIVFNRKKSEQISFPLKGAFLVCSFSALISSITPIQPFQKALLSHIQEIINNYIFVYLFWKELKHLKDIKFFVKGIFFAFSVIIIYTFFERFSECYNPFYEYITFILPEDFTKYFYALDSMDEIRGCRAKAFFIDGLSNGCYTATALSFFYYINMRYKKLWNTPNVIKIIFMLGLLFSVIFSTSRGAIVYLGISLLFMLNFKSIFKLSLLLPIIFTLLYNWIMPYMVNITSLLNLSENEVGGSSIALRVVQVFAAIQVWETRPWLGYGPAAVGYWNKQIVGLYGAETLWLRLMIEKGTIGILAYIYLYYSLFNLAIGKSKRYIIGSVIACFVVLFFTVGFNIMFLASLLLIVYRLELWSKEDS